MTDQIDDVQRSNATRFKLVRAKLLAASGLHEPLSDADTIRIDAASWLALVKENMQHDVLRGVSVDASELMRLTGLIADLLPRAANLQIQFVGTVDQCPACGFERDAPMVADEPAKLQSRDRNLNGVGVPAAAADDVVTVEFDPEASKPKRGVSRVLPLPPIDPPPMPANVRAFMGAAEGIRSDAPWDPSRDTGRYWGDNLRRE